MSETDTWNPQITSTSRFHFILPNATLLSPELFHDNEISLLQDHQLLHHLWESVQAGGRGSNRFSFPFLLLKISPCLISSYNLQLSSWKAGHGFAHCEHNGQFCFFFFRLPRVISCVGRLSYFQINYFQDSYSPMCSEKFHSWLWECSIISECIFTATVLPWRKGIKKTVFGLLPRNGKWGFCSPTTPKLKIVEQLCVKLEW